MSSEDNAIKAQHGRGAKKSLSYVVEELVEFGALTEHKENPTYGYEGCDPNQFKADEEVTNSDGSKYILYSTNSFRSDRVKGQQWDAANIKRINEQIDTAIIVVPDEESLNQADAFLKRMRGGNMFSAIDDIMTVDEFYQAEIKRHGAQLGKGVKTDLEGRKFEDQLARILGDPENLARYNGDQGSVGYQYTVFESIVKAIGLAPGNATKITTTTDIPKLPTGGSPKTDVAATFYSEESARLATFSLKDTSRDFVSVHQYSADAFADVLDPDNVRLRDLLRKFQAAGSMKNMGGENAAALKEELEPLLLKLDLWVFGGFGAKGVTDFQVAQYLVTKNKETSMIGIHDIESYCYAQEERNDHESWFGTVFRWTYASGQRGKSIQLKAQIID